jgi:hypothetical protein
MIQYLDTIIAFVVVMLGLSLLITLLNQTVSSFLSFRGANLRWGIGTMLTTLDPKLKEHAMDIANKILTEPVVSDSVLAGFDKFKNIPYVGPFIQRWRLASAIGPDTLVRVLTNLSESGEAYADNLKQLLKQVDPAAIRKLGMAYAAFGTPPEVPDWTSPPAFPLTSPPDGPPAATKPNYSVQVDDLLKQLGNSAQQSVGRVEAWFNVAMNRVSQRFAMKIRIVTVIFAFILAFGLHFDSLQLMNQLSKNPELRSSLANQSSAMLSEAAAILGDEGGAATVAPKVLQNKMAELIDKDINKETEAEAVLLSGVPANFKNIDEAEKWLLAGLQQGVNEQRQNQLVAKYKSLVVLGLKEQAKDVIGLMKDAGIEFAPKPLPRWNWMRGWREFFGWKEFFWPNGRKNLVGILLTAGLLSLGAPFWYNMLKSVTNLRSVVATKQDEQKKEAAG